ncbi:hypothetical protein H0H92_015810 [Tricholoma furcatifolium]|nr:hypothetical protein H0H92_015810 [Tricholoma furcatifolium]
MASSFQASQGRALACIEALSSISQYETIKFPFRDTDQHTVAKLSQYITLAIRTERHSPLLITKGICALSTLARQKIISQFVAQVLDPNDSVVQYRIPSDIVELSSAADKALRDIEQLRHTLEAKFEEYESRPHDYEIGIQKVVRQYLDTLNTGSKALWAWKTCAIHIFSQWTKEKSHDLFAWYSLLPESGYVLKHGFKGSSNTDSQVELYALQVMALMRQMSVYNSLPAVTSNLFSGNPMDAASRHELGPLSRLLDLCNPLTNYQTLPSTTMKPSPKARRDGPSIPIPKEPPILVEYLGPFGTVACILKDIKATDAAVVSILDLVMRFKSLAPRMVEPHIIREFFGSIFKDHSFFTKCCVAPESAMLFVAIMRVILDWEKEEKESKPCFHLFPAPNAKIDSEVKYNGNARSITVGRRKIQTL